jgi:hypothetical protein
MSHTMRKLAAPLGIAVVALVFAAIGAELYLRATRRPAVPEAGWATSP